MNTDSIEDQPVPIVQYQMARPPTLLEAQEAVGGMVELVTLPTGAQMLCDEEGQLKGKPVNGFASLLACRIIVGDVLILEGDTRWTE